MRDLLMSFLFSALFEVAWVQFEKSFFTPVIVPSYVFSAHALIVHDWNLLQRVHILLKLASLLRRNGRVV